MKDLNRILLPAFLLSLFVSASAGESGRMKTNALGIPGLAADSSQAQPNQYFFLDEAAGDLVLDYPAGLTEENFGTALAGERIRERVKLAIGVRPTLETSVANDAGFVYRYRLGNESAATLRIGKWVLGLDFPGDAVQKTAVPAGWDFETWEVPEWSVQNRLEVMNLIPGARPVTAADLVRRQARWWYRGLGGEPLPPGTCCLTFEIRSPNLPGIVTAYFQGTPHKVTVMSTTPPVLGDRVPAFNFIETNSVSMPVVGPKFEPSMLVETRICDIIGGVERLVRERRLLETPFTGSLLPLSKGCLKRSPAEFEAALEALAGLPKDPFELEILSALRLNLISR